MKYGNISEIAQYNRENGTNFYTMEQVEKHKRKNSAEEFEKKHPFLASLSKSAQEARDARIGAIGAEQVRDLYNKGENELASELNNKYLGANASGILSTPMAGEFVTYGPLVGALRLGAGSAGAAGGSYVAGKAGDFADKKLGTNWIGDTGRLLGGFAGFGAGMKSTTPLLQRAAARNISLGVPKETFVSLRKEGLSGEVARALNREIKSAEIVDSPVTQNILAGKLGWAPRQSRVIWHNSESPISKLESTFPAWDTVERGAPLGHVWGTGSETNLGFIGKRPFHLRSTKPIEMNKPMVQLNESIGSGKNAVRNEILKFADQSEADAINFSNIKDNTLSNQDVYAVLKDVDIKPKLSEAERLGIPKGERSNPKALEDPQYWGYKQWNDRYNAAVESGNVDETQRLRDLHFKIKTSLEPKHYYHGTNARFTQFNENYIGTLDPGWYGKGFYFTPDKGIAEGYASVQTGPNVIYDSFLNVKNPIYRDAGIWDNTIVGTKIPEANDGVFVRLGEPEIVLDKSLQYDPNEIVEVVIPKANQIKLANPIIRTNTGEIVPIVKRDNFRNPDIRYKQGGILKRK